MAEHKKVLVFGAGGQLGQCLKKVASSKNFGSIVFAAEEEANILDETKIEVLFDREQPDFVINCAAYTAVDKAEDELELAKAVNETGAANLAKACKSSDSTLIHISTDFVFKGDTISLLKEDDVAEPISVYGQTKLDGENAIIELLDKHVILRTSWLYSEFANNFVKTMLKLGSERDSLNIIADQIGSPTYAVDLANTIIDIIQAEDVKYGVYHYSNEGAVSWFDFAKAIFEIGNVAVSANPIPTRAYPTKAKRPHFSVMDKTKIKSAYNLSIPYWRDSLALCISALNNA